MNATAKSEDHSPQFDSFQSPPSPPTVQFWQTRPASSFASAAPPAAPPLHSPSALVLPSTAPRTGQRCCVRGCVYPAGATGLCLSHQRQASEPNFFHSLQPTFLVLDRARFGVADSDEDGTRGLDRRRLTAAREAFMEESA